MEPPANRHIATENHKPRLKPNSIPATINPMAMKNPIVRPVLKNEKSFLVKNTTADNPVNKAKVTIEA